MAVAARHWMRIGALVVGLFAVWAPAGAGAAAPPAAAPDPAGATGQLARRIREDGDLTEVLARARRLVQAGLNAGDGYGEVWIRDLNTFVELALDGGEPGRIREALLNFFRFQGDGGDIVDGYIPAARASVGYQYRRSALAPGLLAHKNTVETDQESSLVLAVGKYLAATGDRAFLGEVLGGLGVRDRLGRALEYVYAERFDRERGLVWGATTVDWGDVQPEHAWGVELDSASHRAIDVYDNAMYVAAIRAYLALEDRPEAGGTRARWEARAAAIRGAARRHLWDGERGKFRPHVYLSGSPFPPSLDESAIWYHGGTAVAIEAGFLEPDEIRASLAAMRDNVRKAGAASIGLTVYPPYPDGLFENRSMGAWSYQNGGDWCWFGGRMVQQLIRHGLVEEAYAELKPMVTRVIRHGGFYEWWTRDNQPKGSGQFRGSAGVLGRAILMLQRWAAEQAVSPGH
jgi:hypothetical protein